MQETPRHYRPLIAEMKMRRFLNYPPEDEKKKKHGLYI
jgi:ribosomal protein S21